MGGSAEKMTNGQTTRFHHVYSPNPPIAPPVPHRINKESPLYLRTRPLVHHKGYAMSRVRTQLLGNCTPLQIRNKYAPAAFCGLPPSNTLGIRSPVMRDLSR